MTRTLFQRLAGSQVTLEDRLIETKNWPSGFDYVPAPRSFLDELLNPFALFIVPMFFALSGFLVPGRNLLIALPLTCLIAAFSWWMIGKPVMSRRGVLLKLEDWYLARLPGRAAVKAPT